MDGAGASAYFAALEEDVEYPRKTAVVFSTWAARDPQRAADIMCSLSAMKNAEDLVPGMIVGTARHGADSLIRLSLDPRFRSYDFPTSKPQELMQALKRYGQPDDGEKLWRAHQTASDQRQGGNLAYISHPKLFNALLQWKTGVADTAESAAEVCHWLSGTVDAEPGFEAGAAALYTELRQSDPEASTAWSEVVKFEWLRRAAGLPP